MLLNFGRCSIKFCDIDNFCLKAFDKIGNIACCTELYDTNTMLSLSQKIRGLVETLTHNSFNNDCKYDFCYYFC